MFKKVNKLEDRTQNTLSSLYFHVEITDSQIDIFHYLSQFLKTESHPSVMVFTVLKGETY